MISLYQNVSENCKEGDTVMEFKLDNLSKSYEKKQVICDTSFTFESGKIYGLLGRNGAGKTTLFNCINQDIPVDSGSFYFREKGCEPQKPETTDIGYVLSTPIVPEFLTGREFLKFFLEINKKQIPNQKNLEEYFELINLEYEDRGRLMKDYSHGMKNKMQMLVNIMANPKLLLLDEPLTSLDVVVAEEMKQLLRGMKDDKIIILSTHILDLALDLCDEIVLLNHGKLEHLPKEHLDTADFRGKIIEALREEE